MASDGTYEVESGVLLQALAVRAPLTLQVGVVAIESHAQDRHPSIGINAANYIL